jgi:predicted Fe-Mo cluster-binding NifX family protein
MVICVPVDVDGVIDPRWGRADRVAIAQATAQGIMSWQEFDVGWSTLHDSGGEGSHHARVVRFLLDHRVESVVAHHMGPGMLHTLERMGLPVHLGAAGDAREAVIAAMGEVSS